MEVIKQNWWLIAIPVVLFLLPISFFWTFLALVVCGYIFYKKSNAVSEYKEFLESVDNSIANNTLNIANEISAWPSVEKNTALMNDVKKRSVEWAKRRLKEIRTFDDISYSADDPIDTLAYYNTPELSAEIDKFVDRTAPIVGDQFDRCIDRIKNSKTLSGLLKAIDEFDGESERFTYGTLKLYYRILPWQTEAREEAIKNLSENIDRYIDEKPSISLPCTYTPYDPFQDINIEGAEDSDSEINSILIITGGTLRCDDMKISLAHAEVEFTPRDNSAEDTLDITVCSKRGESEYSFRGSRMFLAYPILQKVIERAKYKANEMVLNQTFEPFEISDPIAKGRKCLYQCSAEFARKIVNSTEDDLDEGDSFKVCGQLVACKVYVFPNALEFIADGRHQSIGISDIVSADLNEYEDVLRIIRRGYATPIGFLDDNIDVLLRAILHAQKSLQI